MKVLIKKEHKVLVEPSNETRDIIEKLQGKYDFIISYSGLLLKNRMSGDTGFILKNNHLELED